MSALAVEYVQVEVQVLDWGILTSDKGPDEGREFAWLSLDTLATVETIELAACLFDGPQAPVIKVETCDPFVTDSSAYALTHWEHPMVRLLICGKPERGQRLQQAFALHLCARCEAGLFKALTSSNRVALTGPLCDEYDEDDRTTWPHFIDARTNLPQVRQAELGAWRRAYKLHADEGEQLTIYSDAE
jgi:hypothetical protein